MSPDRSKAELEALLHRFQGVDYWRRRQLLWHRVRPRLDRFLYKFRALVPADSTSVDRIRDVIVRSRLWLSSATDFNDPFDMAAKIVVDGTAQQKRTRFNELLKRQGKTLKERLKALPTLVARTNDNLAALAQQAHGANIQRTGVCSFGGDPRSILAWSHYGKDHEGLCYVFESARDLTTFVQAVEVEYNDDYPVINWLTEFDSDNLIKILLRKHTGWRYEQERRIIIPERGRTYIAFRPEALRAVILGCRGIPEVRAKLAELFAERASLGYSVPTLYQARKHDSRYELLIHKVA